MYVEATARQIGLDRVLTEHDLKFELRYFSRCNRKDQKNQRWTAAATPPPLLCSLFRA